MLLECGLNYSALSFTNANKNVIRRCYSIKNLLGFFKKSHEDKKETEKDSFQSWAEFENRGYKRPEYMRSWMIEKYGDINDVLKLEILNTPSNKLKPSVDARRAYFHHAIYRPSDVLVKVHAVSLNPIDIKICQGYGANLFNFRRNMFFDRIYHLFFHSKSVREEFGDREFPLPIGRDFSGTVVDVGSSVFDIKVGDEVFGAPSLFRAGTLTDYVNVDLSEVVHRPVTLSHIEAAAIPYVGLTVTSALRHLVTHPIIPKHALVLGGSGGVGTFAIQYLQAYGYTVTTTCSTEGITICNKLGANCIDYTKKDVEKVVSDNCEKFSIIFDPVGATSPEWAQMFLVENGTYVSLKSPLLDLTSRYGTIVGASNTYLIYLTKKFKSRNTNIHWAYFAPDREALLEVARVIDAGLIKPVVLQKNIFSFEDVLAGYKELEQGHTKGKIVINVSGLPEAVLKPEVNRIVHL